MSAASARIGVIGAGAWGTALAHLLADDGAPVVLWARDGDLAQTINRTRANHAYLPGVALHQAIRATADPADLARLELLLLVTPAQATSAVLAQMPPF